MNNNEVLLKFENKDQADAFLAWFSNSGEQDYFEQREYEDDPTNICDQIEYDYQNNILNFSYDNSD
jgi:hypothetical protein